MRSTFHGIEMMKRSIFTHQTSLQTVGHNISNANTKGYSRQRVNHVSMFPLDYPSLQRTSIPGQLGQGVEFDSIKRVREQFLDAQFIKEQREFGAWSIRRDSLEKLENIFNEPSDSGIRKVLEKFWNSWQDLSKDPENLSARAVVRETALATADTFNQISRQITDLASDLTTSIEMKVKEINTYANQLSSLNEQIFRMELLGGNANDLRDKRDLVIDDLSKIINITVVENNEGYKVSIGTKDLVDGNKVVAPVTSASLRESFDLGGINSGEVYGMFYSIDRYTTYYKNQLDSMVVSFVEGVVEVTIPKGSVIPEGYILNVKNEGSFEDVEYTGGIAERTLQQDTVVKVKGINQLHQLGYQMKDELAVGPPLFVIKSGETTMNASTISVNPAVMSNLTALAASNRVYSDVADTPKVVIGNGNNALAISNIRLSTIEFVEGIDQTLAVTGNYDDFFRALVGALGVQTQEAKRQELNQKFLAEQVDSRRQSVSGVSMDEEMADMVKFQHAYNAAARHMTTYDEMLDKIINGMGQVGR